MGVGGEGLDSRIEGQGLREYRCAMARGFCGTEESARLSSSPTVPGTTQPATWLGAPLQSYKKRAIGPDACQAFEAAG